MKESWVKLFSKLIEWQWYKDQNTKSLFIHCLLKANWKDGKFEGMDVPRGSFVTGRKKLSEELGISEQSIRTSINKLKATNEITTKITNKFTIITIVNYEKYQEIKENVTNELTNNLTNEQPTTNQQNLKNNDFSTNNSTNSLTLELLEKSNVVNQDINQQLTNKNLENAKNQPQSKTIDNRHINSVCNAHAREEFVCHLGCKQKTINCINCMKKYQCPLEDEPLFKITYGIGFYEYVALKERKEKAIAMELEEMHDSNSNQELVECDWLNGNYD